MKTKHTPGPWMVHTYDVNLGPYNKALDVGTSGRAVAKVIGEFENPKVGDQARANARLIAAAPELLEALEAVTRRLEHVLHKNGISALPTDIKNARAAIAKARGE